MYTYNRGTGAKKYTSKILPGLVGPQYPPALHREQLRDARVIYLGPRNRST